MHKLISHSL